MNILTMIIISDEMRKILMTNNNVKLSIIIPIYNVEKYLPQCIESCVNQTLKDIEIILINDGSTDNSLDICKKYTKEDSRIKLISKENEGVSVARNQGINVAVGEYIQFVDADDWLEQDCCKLAYDMTQMHSADIVYFGFYSVENGKKYTKNLEMLEKLKTGTVDKIALKSHLYTIWDRIYKKDFLNKHGIRFVNMLKTAEDGIFNFYCSCFNPVKSYLPEALYNYRYFRDGAATSTLKLESEITTFKFLISSKYFNSANDDCKILALEKSIDGLLFWYFHPVCKNYLKENTQKVKELHKQIVKQLGKTFLQKIPNYDLLSDRFSFETFAIKDVVNGEIKRKVLVLFGHNLTIYTIEQNFITTAWKIKFLGIPILKSKVKNTFLQKEKLYLFGFIPLVKRNIKKRLQKRYMDILIDLYPEYDCYYTFACDLGELFLFLCHFEEFSKNYNAKSPLFIFDKKNMASVYKVFDNINIPNAILGDASPYFLEPYTIYKNKKFISPFNTEYFTDYADTYINKGEHYYELLKQKLGIQKVSAIPIIDMSNVYVSAVAKSILDNNFVIILPEAVSICELPSDFWVKLCGKLQKNGYKVFLNVGTMSASIDGTTTVFLSIKDVIELSKYAKAIIALRSGLAEILAITSFKPTFVIYNRYADYIPTKMNAEKVKAGFSLQKLPQINPKKIHEYIWEEQTLDELVMDIVDKICRNEVIHAKNCL